MPIYKMDGKKNGRQKYRVRVNYIDREGKNRQIDRVAYGYDEAKDLERQLNHDIKSAPVCRYTVQQLYDEFISVKKYEVRESTLRVITVRCENYILPELGTYRIDKLTSPVLQKWKNAVENYKPVKSPSDSLSFEMKKGIYSALRALLNYAVKMDYIAKNPLLTVGNFRDAYETKHEMDFYTADEFKKFIAAAREQAQLSSVGSVYEWNFYVFFAIAFYTGMRKGEINALRWTDLDGKTIHVRRSVNQKLKGKDRETPPKNKSSIRDLQTPAPLMKILGEHRTRCESVKGFSESWHICGGAQCLRDTTIQHRNERYSQAAGLKTIRIHDFRHSHASLLANNAINIQEIARRLGHSNIEMTWNIYSHLYPQEEERALQILDNI